MAYSKKQLELLRELTSVQFRLKDQGTTLGVLWSLLHPLLMLLVLLTVFSHKFGGGTENFPLYVLVGVVHFTFFANATGSAMHSLYGMHQLTRDAIFPKELVVVGTILSRTTEYLIALALCIAIAFATGVRPSLALLSLPAIMLLHFLFVVWVSLLLSFAYLFVRDIDHLYQVVLRALFFLTPIFYELSFLGEGLPLQLVSLNPLTPMIAMARAAILDGQAPPLLGIANQLVIHLLIAWLSLTLFRRVEPRFAEAL